MATKRTHKKHFPNAVRLILETMCENSPSKGDLEEFIGQGKSFFSNPRKGEKRLPVRIELSSGGTLAFSPRSLDTFYLLGVPGDEVVDIKKAWSIVQEAEGTRHVASKFDLRSSRVDWSIFESAETVGEEDE